MKKSEYHKLIDSTLKPTLVKYGFEEVKLKNIMSPEVLYRKDDLWFGTSNSQYITRLLNNRTTKTRCAGLANARFLARRYMSATLK